MKKVTVTNVACMEASLVIILIMHWLILPVANTLINITTDVTLSSPIRFSIIGNSNPTVKCKSIGRIHITFCKNRTIQGITWDECSTKHIDNHTEPGLMLRYLSIITIQNCFFQHSVGQAVALSEVSVMSNYISNHYYGGHAWGSCILLIK